DPLALHAQARLLGEAGEGGRSVVLRERAAQAAGKTPRAAAMLVEIGEIYEKDPHEDDKAREAYERALALDARPRGAMRALAQLHRKARRPQELRGVLERELALTEEPARRLTLHLEVARLLDAAGEAGEAALAHYREALELDPGNAPAQAGLERL